MTTPAALDVPALLAELTLEEKASLCSGADFWHTKAVERAGVPAVMVTDGPHGLRKQAGSGDHVGLGESVPATCFPPAVRWAPRSTPNWWNGWGGRWARRRAPSGSRCCWGRASTSSVPRWRGW